MTQPDKNKYSKILMLYFYSKIAAAIEKQNKQSTTSANKAAEVEQLKLFS